MSGQRKLKQGLVQVYTGDGKGKTTAALGQSWRAIGQGLKVSFIQFMKGGMKTGEQLAAEAFGDKIKFIQISADAIGKGRKSDSDESWWMKSPDEIDRECARQALEYVKDALQSGEYDIIVCDEINVACHKGLISTEDVLGLIEAKPKHIELILTGQNAKPEVIAAADLVTEMRLIKHPFFKEIPARKGIEF